ncbi:hypothetical protein FA048_09525 [Pedobacter polaris]|uniref:Uncharacterized protein n=1 Tax=Pedobacter polaris TaxID=2571273 RepID=A0A4U1CW01_9SPHI|nr:hypothetical protein [Pedobacter polaris]TKC10419.1 hypothetical protein FA048_09525 [Pedobacter polaris]
MKDNIFNLNETKFLDDIQGFFSTSALNDHLLFIDYWMELLLGGKPRKKRINLSNLYFFYEKMVILFESCHELLQLPQELPLLENKAKVETTFLITEKQTLSYFPYQLKVQELINPFKAIKAVFKKHDLHFYLQILKKWIAVGLNTGSIIENTTFIVPLYGNAKKLIAACWLIHERIVSKNSFRIPTYQNPLLNFALTEPFLFEPKVAANPFSMIESFFSFTNLSGYRQELQKWYTAAITENLRYENPNDLFFIYNQYLLLIQAGYFIVTNNLTYKPKPNQNNQQVFGQWLLKIRDDHIENGELTLSDESPHLLALNYRTNPLAYCKEQLTLPNIIKLRLGLKEWLEAGLSNNVDINGITPEYAFEQYLTLQKITEAFYIIITAIPNAEVLTVATHEA